MELSSAASSYRKSTPLPNERCRAKGRVLAAHPQGKDWKEAAISNNITIATARRVVSRGTTSPQAVSGVCDVRVKMTLKTIAKLEEL
ncbi:hypothetical protein PybrP1_010069 [[Pythium] brassicae (nom. inval.)]|nr:hypothetical protein PybrP1_010069 [[Pythium] brassicae (nom. inval.)]